MPLPQKHFIILLIILLILTIPSLNAQSVSRELLFQKQAEDAIVIQKRDQIIRAAVELVRPSVVHIEATKWQRTKRSLETGSGVLISVDMPKSAMTAAAPAPNAPVVAGFQTFNSEISQQLQLKKYFVLTNRHVVAEMEFSSIRIHLHDKRVLTPKSRLMNTERDFALLEINTVEIEAESLTAAKIGDSGSVDVADTIIVMGSPFGLSQSVSVGSVSAKNRLKIPIGNQPFPLHGFFQTDASINPGNSGGPLANVRGEIVGIITAIASASGSHEGVAFAMPINPLYRSACELARTGRVTRPYIGIELDPKFDQNVGAKVTRVNANSPAEKAGFVSGDVLMQFNGIEIENDLHFVSLVAECQSSDAPSIVLLRNGEYFAAKPTLMAQESE